MPREPRGNFVHHAPTDEHVAQIQSVREKCRELHVLLETLPNNRELSLAIAKLEEVSMWSNKSIVLGTQ